jgi:energy-coupling factor transporter transmembrane protein EcfT
MTEKPRWWLIVVAALMAAIFLYQNIGLMGEIVLIAGIAVGSVGYRIYRSRQRARTLPRPYSRYVN